MSKAVVVAFFVFVGGLAVACSSSGDGGGTPLVPGSGSSTSSSSSGSSGDAAAGATKYCYRYHDKAAQKGLCVCGALYCAKKTSGECGCIVDPYGVDTAQIECTPGPLATPTNGETATQCCLAQPTGDGFCRCGTTASCAGGKPTPTCSRTELTTKQLAPGNVIFEDAKIRVTAMAPAEVDQWLADGRATKQGANTLCNQP